MTKEGFARAKEIEKEMSLLKSNLSEINRNIEDAKKGLSIYIGRPNNYLPLDKESSLSILGKYQDEIKCKIQKLEDEFKRLC